MADTKISALTAATTPLAGTEVLPIVQSSTTKKVSVANLTSGRAVDVLSLTVATNGYPYLDGNAIYVDSGYAAYITGTAKNGFSSINFYTNSTLRMQVATTSGDVTVSTGNIIQGTAAKGINFTANTPAAGMTSQLLNWYEEGTWTPTAGGSSTSGTYTLSNVKAYYTRVGNQVTVTFSFGFSAASGGTGYFKISGLPFATKANTFASGSLMFANLDLDANCKSVSLNPTSTTGVSTLLIEQSVDNGSIIDTAPAAVSTSTVLYGSLTYLCA